VPSDLPFGETWAMALAPDGSVIDHFDDFNDLAIEFKDGLAEALPRGRPMTLLLRDGTHRSAAARQLGGRSAGEVMASCNSTL
jgi:hypothetical protein